MYGVASQYLQLKIARSISRRWDWRILEPEMFKTEYDRICEIVTGLQYFEAKQSYVFNKMESRTTNPIWKYIKNARGKPYDQVIS